MSDESRRAAGILAQCKWLRDQISQWEKQAKEVIARELEGGERTKAVAADGTVIGSVARAEGARSMQIDNEEGFLMWVKHRYPHEVVETVRPAFVRLCAEKVKMLGALPDANGELCPHVSLVVGEPKATVQLKDQDRAVIEDMFMHRHMPEVMASMEALELPAAVYDGPIEDTATAMREMMQKMTPEGYVPQQECEADRVANQYISGESKDSPCQDVSRPEDTEPEPFIEEGPPDWLESNTFEDRDFARGRRGD